MTEQLKGKQFSEKEIKQSLDKFIKDGILKMVLVDGEWCYVNA